MTTHFNDSSELKESEGKIVLLACSLRFLFEYIYSVLLLLPTVCIFTAKRIYTVFKLPKWTEEQWLLEKSFSSRCGWPRHLEPWIDKLAGVNTAITALFRFYNVNQFNTSPLKYIFTFSSTRNPKYSGYISILERCRHHFLT